MVIFRPLFQLPGPLGKAQANPDRGIGVISLVVQVQGHEANEMVPKVQVQPVAFP